MPYVNIRAISNSRMSNLDYFIYLLNAVFISDGNPFSHSRDGLVFFTSKPFRL